jgi:nitrogen fixation/metabolism regulation signal transduction histidine kinase
VARRLAHEIKNPLTPIQLSAERLRHRLIGKIDGAEAEILERATHTIINQVEAMKTMVNAFSEYARVPKISLGPMNLNRLVREVMDLYRGGDLNVQLIERLDASQDCIEGDAGRLRQLLHNLFKNALEAVRDTPQARITVLTRVLDEAGKQRLELCVEDNGPGFAQEVLENAFEPYVSTKPRGSGLGLAIVKKIVEEHGGTISAENAPGGGAQIRIRLLLAGADAEAGCGEQAATDAARGERG